MLKTEIKKLKVCRGDETDAFSCDFYVQDTLVAHVRQSGTGGCHFYDWVIDGAAKLREDLLAQVKAESPEWLPQDFDWNEKWQLDMCLDMLVWDLVETEQENKKLRSLCKKSTVFRTKDNKPGEWEILSTPWAGNETRIRAFLTKDFGDKLVEIANERFAA